MVTRSKAGQEALDKVAPPWAKCPAFRHVLCHAPWQCVQPCMGLRDQQEAGDA